MTRRSLSLLVLFGVAALALGGCETDSASNKSFQPIPDKTLALMKQKGMTRRDPILMRIYKEESQLEIWKRTEKGRYGLLKTYEICRWSGTLGPKKVEGDGQSPEGFYQVTPGQMNPKSAYYLSFNLGFPNAFDKSLGRTGAHLMVHGDCLSKGCYAMTDKQIAEVYSIAREALNAGQPSFQVQALPFRMTAENLARRRDDKNFEFWQNLKEGTDHFETTRIEPKVNVCGKKYVFDAEPRNGGTFDPNAACPEYDVNPAIAMAVAGKDKQDDEKFAKLVSSGLQTAEAYVPQNGRERRTLKDPIKRPQPVVMVAKAESEPKSSFALAMASTESTGSSVPMPVPSPYASAQPKQQKSGGAFAWLRGDAEPDAARAPQPTTTPAQSAATTVAMADQRRTAAPGQPVAASFAPVSKDKPFYKRWLGFGGDKQAAAPAAPAPQPQTAAAPVPAPVPAPRPAAISGPQPQASTPSAPPVSHGLSTAPILSTGGFQ
jgi:murein L,D-transpeptidase YafK